MNISIQTTNLNYITEIRRAEEAVPKTDVLSASSGSQDRLTLSRSRIPADDRTFARMLAHRCADGIRNTASEEKFLRLQAEVTDGTYRPDPARIAEKLLGHS